jgi:hypothetical protein
MLSLAESVFAAEGNSFLILQQPEPRVAGARIHHEKSGLYRADGRVPQGCAIRLELSDAVADTPAAFARSYDP